MSRISNIAVAKVVPWDVPDIGADEQRDVPRTFHDLGQERLDPKGWRRHLDPSAPPEREEPSAPPRPPDKAHLESIERGLAEGRERGFAEGHAAALTAAEPMIAERLRRLDAVLQSLSEPVRALERPVEEAVLALALEVARRVVVGEVKMSRDFLVSLIRDAVAKVPIDIGSPKVVLHPDDLALVRSLAPDLEAHGIAFIADDTIEPGGCVVTADDNDERAVKDRRWHPRVYEGVCQVDLTLASRWRDVMMALFEGEEL